MKPLINTTQSLWLDEISDILSAGLTDNNRMLIAVQRVGLTIAIVCEGSAVTYRSNSLNYKEYVTLLRDTLDKLLEDTQ